MTSEANKPNEPSVSNVMNVSNVTHTTHETEGDEQLRQFDVYQKWTGQTWNANGCLELELINCIMGVSGEAGELTEIMKKVAFQGHPLNPETIHKMAYEVGDVLFYLARLAAALEFPLSAIAKLNRIKLEARYPEGKFDSKRSIDRVG